MDTIKSTSPIHPTTVIESQYGWNRFGLKEIWSYRELLYFLVWRDLKVRYKQSFLGAAWIIIQPLVTMFVFTLFFNRLLGVASGSDLPYPIVTYAALLPWTYFAFSLSRCSTSLVADKNLIAKIYFPRLLIPLSGVLPGLVDFAISFSLLVMMMVVYRIPPTVEIIFLPFVLLLALITALGVGLWLSALHVQYRDVQYIAPFLIQIWMYATPIIYPISAIPIKWRWLYSLNPMVGVVQYFRRVLLGDPTFGGLNWISVLITILIFATGLVFFNRMQRTFADVI